MKITLQLDLNFDFATTSSAKSGAKMVQEWSGQEVRFELEENISRYTTKHRPAMRLCPSLLRGRLFLPATSAGES